MSKKNLSFQSFSDHFLIASPQLSDPFFEGSVIYLCEHSQEGAMGVIINKPSPVKMEQLFDAVEKPTPARFIEQWVLMGGPVNIDRGFLIHSPVGNWQSSMLVNDDIAVTTSRDIIADLSSADYDNVQTFATIGYSNWSEGQLEKELIENSWLICPADKKILFELPYFRRYGAALNSIGIRSAALFGSIGNA